MPKPGGRGGKKSHKGQKRHFTSEDEIRAQQEKEEKEKAWRKQRGIESDESEEEEEGASKRGAARGAPGELPPSDSEEESSEEESDKHKGVEHLIEIQNPNRSGARQAKKISELNEDGTAQLSRREREEIAKQQAAARYRKLHLEGKTEEAQADLARLALIRKERAEAAKRREEEQKAKAAKEAQKKAANK